MLGFYRLARCQSGPVDRGVVERYVVPVTNYRLIASLSPGLRRGHDQYVPIKGLYQRGIRLSMGCQCLGLFSIRHPTITRYLRTWGWAEGRRAQLYPFFFTPKHGHDPLALNVIHASYV